MESEVKTMSNHNHIKHRHVLTLVGLCTESTTWSYVALARYLSKIEGGEPVSREAARRLITSLRSYGWVAGWRVEERIVLIEAIKGLNHPRDGELWARIASYYRVRDPKLYVECERASRMKAFKQFMEEFAEEAGFKE